LVDLAIHSNRVITPDRIISATVFIKNGKITDIAPGLSSGNIIDVKDKILMPGVIDPHVHINEPGRTAWEGFDTATRSAIAGGITSLVDMPLNSSPVTTTLNGFEQKLIAAKNQLHTNCGFWGGIVPGNTNEIDALVDKGVLGFKAFLIDSGIDEFPKVSENDLRIAMPVIAKHKLPLLVHCELNNNKDQGIRNDQTSYQNYLASRPKQWENDAIALMIRLCEEYNCPVHIVHLSSAESIEQINNAKQKGLQITVETAQHYLYFSAEQIDNGQTQFKCAPPIREKTNNDLLWNALKNGVIDFVATDHSPSTPDLKELKSGDFTRAWGGIASLQLALPVLWTSGRKRNYSLIDISKWMSSNPSKLMGKDNSMGKIAIGFDADLIVWDADASFVVTEQLLHHKHKVTPYLGEELFGVVEQTYLRGINVFDKGIFTHLKKGEIITRAGNE
jgi:allantoinase